MEFVLLVILLAVAIVVGVMLYKQRAKAQQSQAPVQSTAPADPFATATETEGDPRGIKAGDMIDWGNERTWIRGSLRLSEGGAVWAEHFLEVEGGRRWLSVEEDPDLQLSLWSARPDLDLVPQGKAMEVEGTTYKLQEKGSGSYRSEGTTGLKPEGGLDYVDYEADDGSLLSFERFDHGSWEASTGKTIMPGTFTIYPGS